MSSDESDPEFVQVAAKYAESFMIPAKSKIQYRKVYDGFITWKMNNNVKTNSENVVLAYIVELSKTIQPTSAWAYYSMLKAMMKLEDNVDISQYHKVTAFLKHKSTGHKPIKATAFSACDIHNFITEASDREWLDVKVACIFGISGCLRTIEFMNIKVDDIEKHGNLLLVNVTESKTNVSRSFTIFLAVVKQYVALRSPRTIDKRFFMNYRDGKCTIQPIGKKEFSKMPSRIATFLNLPSPKSYTGHSFLRSSASILAMSGGTAERLMRHGAWRSSKVSEGYVQESLTYKKESGQLITSKITTSVVYASQGYSQHVKDDSAIPMQELLNSDIPIQNLGAMSLGYSQHARDDSDIQLENLPSFSAAPDADNKPHENDSSQAMVHVQEDQCISMQTGSNQVKEDSVLSISKNKIYFA